MIRPSKLLLATAATLLLAANARADDQTQPGAGNAAAAATAKASALVQSALERLKISLEKGVTNPTILAATKDALFNPKTCVKHRANLTVAQKQAIVNQIIAAGLVNPPDAASITGGVYAGIFPALLNDADGANSCPNLPMPWYAAAGSGNGSHHSYPGGLPIHEAFNDNNAVNLADSYRNVYGILNAAGLPVVGRIGAPSPATTDETISQDDVTGAPLWHDWAKPMVFQFNADGTEFIELNFGGNGTNDNNGAAGDSRTGGHHIISLAESIARGLPVDFIITQASAHSNPTLGNEYKVVNWLRTAAILAQVDPLAYGLLAKDSSGNFRLPPLRHQADLNLNNAGLGNILLEYPLHNLSDADFTNSIPSISLANFLLQNQATAFGFDPVNAASTYQIKFRNVALSNLSAELIESTYNNQGLAAVTALLTTLHNAGKF